MKKSVPIVVLLFIAVLLLLITFGWQGEYQYTDENHPLTIVNVNSKTVDLTVTLYSEEFDRNFYIVRNPALNAYCSSRIGDTIFMQVDVYNKFGSVVTKVTPTIDMDDIEVELKDE